VIASTVVIAVVIPTSVLVNKVTKYMVLLLFVLVDTL